MRRGASEGVIEQLIRIKSSWIKGKSIADEPDQGGVEMGPGRAEQIVCGHIWQSKRSI
jgi:hypothetical protein